MPAADTRAAGGTASWLTIPASTSTHSSVCPRASDKLGGIFFGAKVTGWAYRAPVGATIALASGAGDNHANNLTQNARTLLTEDAGPASFGD